MSNRDVAPVRKYLDAVFRRAREPMEPRGYEPDWADQPSRYKTYPGMPLLPLPASAPPRLAPVGDLLAPPATERAWTLEDLAVMLRLSYGVLGRRLRVDWNQDAVSRASYPHSVWSRGTASGGGMYPLEIYWVSGPGGPLLPGVYHYATGHHGLTRLLTADLTGQVRAALGAEAGEEDQFLLVTVKFWKNSFKYNSFCYHVVSQDLGALLGTWELLARALGHPLRRLMWFDDRALNDILGLDTMAESVFAAVPLPWAEPPGRARPAAGRPVLTVDPRPVRVRAVPFERSRVLRRFPAVEEVHEASLVADEQRPDPELARCAAPVPATDGPRLALPPPAPLPGDLGDVLASRHSSFGTFSGLPLSAVDLSTVLHAAATTRQYRTDTRPVDAPLTRLSVLAHRVDGVPAGAYTYDVDGHSLAPVQAADAPERGFGWFLQSRYFLTNYGMDRVAATVVLSGRPDPVLDVLGNRGYRILSAEVGAVAQTVYLAATARGLGCGAVLGLDNIALNEVLGFHRTDERTFLFLLLGQEHRTLPDVDYRLA